MHSSKIMLYILQARQNDVLTPQIAPEQTGFVKGRGTSKQILNARQLIEKSTPYQCTFASWSVRGSKLREILDELGAPSHLISLVKTSEAVRQGCIHSPLLYNVYSEIVKRRVLEDWNGSVKIDGKRFSNLLYADDTLLIARGIVRIP